MPCFVMWMCLSVEHYTELYVRDSCQDQHLFAVYSFPNFLAGDPLSQIDKSQPISQYNFFNYV